MPLSVTLHCVALNLPGHTAALATLATPFAAGLNPEFEARCRCTLPGAAALFPWEQLVAMVSTRFPWETVFGLGARKGPGQPSRSDCLRCCFGPPLEAQSEALGAPGGVMPS